MTGWNLTETECLEDREARLCLSNMFYDFLKLEESTKACCADCISKCEQHSLEMTISEVEVDLKRDRLLAAFAALYYASPDNVLAGQFLHALTTSSEPEEKVKEISQNIAQLTFYLQGDKADKHVEIIPMMTLATFLGNIRGHIGMWLGVSAISVVELLEAVFFRLITQKSCGVCRID